MNNLDKELFDILDEKSKEVYSKFAKFYVKDSKPFINKISRDYEKIGFPVHVLKTISKIDKSKYHGSAICVLRGGIPYSILFKLYGWKIHYVLCGRKNEQHGKLRFNRNVDKTLKEIRGKKILIIENNSPTGTTPILVANNLKRSFNIKKPDLFLDYYMINTKKLPLWLQKIGPFCTNTKKKSNFGKIYVAKEIRVSKKENEKLKKDFLIKLKNLKNY